MNPASGDLCSVRWSGNLLLDEPRQWSQTVNFYWVFDGEIALITHRKGSFCHVVLQGGQAGWIAWDYLKVIKKPRRKKHEKDQAR